MEALEHRHADYEIWWSVNHVKSQTQSIQCWESVDVVLLPTSAEPMPTSDGSELYCDFARHPRTWLPASFHKVLAHSLGLDKGTKVSQFLTSTLWTAHGGNFGENAQVKAVKLVIPRRTGYLARTDTIPIRMMDCPNVTRTASFSEPRQLCRVPGLQLAKLPAPGFEVVLAAAVAGIQLETSSLSRSTVISDLAALENQLQERLSFDWILQSLPPTQTLVMVRGALSPPEYGGTGSNIYSAARNLGIKLVVLDKPGHWLQGPSYSHLIEDFVPLCGMDRDPNLPAKIVDALSRYERKIDGITTFFETYAALVATAAQQLGLPTESPDALAIAADKYETSIAAGHLAFRVSTVQDTLKVAASESISYPVIVKPCTGWSSEGVSKVNKATELIAATNFNRHAHYVIEEYCDGPEVDANLILMNGELLFCEISDDFPKNGDNEDSSASDFAETANVFPSKLPPDELTMLRGSLHRTLLSLGFVSGMFHLEARIKDSRMAYTTKQGILDLEQRNEDVPGTKEPSSWLIEINQRPPGIQATQAIQGAFGIDYVGLGLLIPLEDKERVRVLSVPHHSGPQYWCELVFIGAKRGGTFHSQDVSEELKQRRPDLARHISTSRCFFKKGDRVPFPSHETTVWVAYYVVFSLRSRSHVLELAEDVRSSTRVSILD